MLYPVGIATYPLPDTPIFWKVTELSRGYLIYICNEKLAKQGVTGGRYTQRQLKLWEIFADTWRVGGEGSNLKNFRKKSQEFITAQTYLVELWGKVRDGVEKRPFFRPHHHVSIFFVSRRPKKFLSISNIIY